MQRKLKCSSLNIQKLTKCMNLALERPEKKSRCSKGRKNKNIHNVESEIQK